MKSIAEAPMEMKNRNDASSIKTIIANNLSEEIIEREQMTVDEGNNRKMKIIFVLFCAIAHLASLFSLLVTII